MPCKIWTHLESPLSNERTDTSKKWGSFKSQYLWMCNRYKKSKKSDRLFLVDKQHTKKIFNSVITEVINEVRSY